MEELKSMEIKIYKGKELGGCIGKISTKKQCLIIDYGVELPGKTATPKWEDIVDDNLNTSVFFTHNHADHNGNFLKIPNDVDCYFGKASKELLKNTYKKLYASNLKNNAAKYDVSFYSGAFDKIDKSKTYTNEETITIGDISITPFLVSHSIFDSYAFLIEADGESILWTGDYRDIPYSNDFISIIDKIKMKLGNEKLDYIVLEKINMKNCSEESIESIINSFKEDNPKIIPVHCEHNEYVTELDENNLVETNIIIELNDLLFALAKLYDFSYEHNEVKPFLMDCINKVTRYISLFEEDDYYKKLLVENIVYKEDNDYDKRFYKYGYFKTKQGREAKYLLRKYQLNYYLYFNIKNVYNWADDFSNKVNDKEICNLKNFLINAYNKTVQELIRLIDQNVFNDTPEEKLEQINNFKKI